MKKTILVEPCLRRFSYLFVLCVALVLSASAFAKVNVSPLFVELSDAMADVRQGQAEQVRPHLQIIQDRFSAIPQHDSEAGQEVSRAIAIAIENPTPQHLEDFSRALYKFEKEQNPVDYREKRKQFTRRVLPVYRQLDSAIVARDLNSAKALYKRFNTVWTFNEKVVRETSLGQYGQIETAMTFIRIAMITDPPDYSEMQKQSEILGVVLNDFKEGRTTEVQATANALETLPDGIVLLRSSLESAQNNDPVKATEGITTFVRQWPVFEGDVRTRDASLYARVESELPVILSRIAQAEGQMQLRSLLTDLEKIDVGASYSMMDAMLVLLREGVEALLIVMALLTALNAAGQPRARSWVYAGAGLGVVTSLIVAIALQRLFPVVSAGTNREILEGIIGIAAVVMMLFIGGWLHSKSSVVGWKEFIDRHVAQSLATGSLVSMLGLSFLAVFREGAETILFYAGMLPRMMLSDFLMGVGLALVLLAATAFIISRSALFLPMHRLFKWMTFLLYALGFKMSGVSVHGLQLTEVLPTHIIDGLPRMSLIGFYSTWETVLAQVVYLALIPVVTRWFNR